MALGPPSGRGLERDPSATRVRQGVSELSEGEGADAGVRQIREYFLTFQPIVRACD
jgi:hypothetical protein